MKAIPLSRSEIHMLVDDEDYDFVSAHACWLTKKGSSSAHGYASTGTGTAAGTRSAHGARFAK